MDAGWITSPTGRRVLAHWADLRPAWLWSSEGQAPLWRNAAARLFGARVKKGELRLAGEARPIKGQIARLIRLGSPGRTALARLHFLAEGRPLSATGACTPLPLPDGTPGLLVVAVDPVDPECAETHGQPDRLSEALFPPGTEYLVFNESGRLVAGSPTARERIEPNLQLEAGALTTGDVMADGVAYSPTGYRASPLGARLILFAPAATESASPEKPEEFTAAEPAEAATAEPKAAPAEPPPEPAGSGRMLYRITARRLTPIAATAEAPTAPAASAAPEPAASEPPPDAESVERVSRYNFDELGRILADRIGLDPQGGRAAPAGMQPPRTAEAPPRAPRAELVSLTGETFVLNRLPLGVLVFRDHQVLFANRALLDLVGHDNVESLRGAGLAAVFPITAPAMAGAVTRLRRRDGEDLPVTARLQSVVWQGKPALMLSASAAESRLGHEAAVRAFAEILADARHEGFLVADTSGTLTFLSGHARQMLGAAAEPMLGQPLSRLLEADQLEELRTFLDRPARFAETARPSVLLRGLGGATEVLLFAEGQAGVVAGYFGFVRRRHAQPPLPAPHEGGDGEPALLNRVSRGIRRPLNTVVGFSDIIASAAFGPIDNPRYAEYARDIRTAGHEIAALVDELDDYARLKEGRYAPRPTEIDLGMLLESCVVRVREQARRQRVLVRSAISERLPRIRADRASLGQAVLNLMASAIDQTPPGGSVVLSARRERDGGIAVNVRDSARRNPDLTERFVVFHDELGPRDGLDQPVRSSMGLALTRSLLAVNACSLSVDPAGVGGLLFSLVIPAELVIGA